MMNTLPAQDGARKRGAPALQPLHAAEIESALLKLPTVVALVGLSGPTIYRKMAAGEFPQPVRLSPRCARWVAGDVTRWLARHAPQAEAA